ncbi:hypothetical protein [Blastococcus saxobsidens]|uniref:DUF4386 family protein n=1 Tax=Blastococcus saxobsidens TaxID=138336 RepID=A0A4Q7Y341_9ACTN|nr:hypothetical protein [Blastococcus saxobsidens]RZU30491.1 hypothetical protein BKA19_0107 [Blastococcus saxobsidens]
MLAAVRWLSFASDGIGMATAADLGDAVTVQVLLTTGWESARTAAVPTLVMVVAAVVAGLRHGVFPRWFSWFSLAVLAPLLVALTPLGPSGLLGVVFGGLWVLVTSILLAVESPSGAPKSRSTATEPSM